MPYLKLFNHIAPRALRCSYTFIPHWTAIFSFYKHKKSLIVWSKYNNNLSQGCLLNNSCPPYPSWKFTSHIFSLIYDFNYPKWIMTSKLRWMCQGYQRDQYLLRRAVSPSVQKAALSFWTFNPAISTNTNSLSL